jgi:hypothetical protein
VTLARLSSPLDLANAARVELPSSAVSTSLAALYGLAPTAEDKAVWKRISRQPWPKKRARRGAFVWGRRGLKTSGVLAWSCVFETLCGGHEKYAAPGSRIYAIVVAPRVPQAREAVLAIRAVLDQLAPLGVKYEMRDANNAPEIVITEPAAPVERVIAVQTCDSVAVRSRAVFFLGADEAGRWPSEEWLAERDVDVIAAIRGAMPQFPDAIECFTSNPGKPGSYFHSLVTKPRAGTLVSTAASWVSNPRISRARCWELAEGNEEVFQREYEATRWGAAGGSFLDATAVWASLGSEHAGKGPRPGSFLVAFDHGQLKDACAIVAVSAFEQCISPTVSPVRHLVVEEAIAIPSSKKDPQPTSALVGRLVAVAKSYGDAPILFDVHAAPDVADELKKYGWRPFVEADGERGKRVPGRRRYLQCSVAPQAQHPRWIGLQGIVAGRRLHLSADMDRLAKEMVGLAATMQSSGWIKVEGRGSSPDNLVDALALTVPYLGLLPPTDGPGGAVRRDTRVGFTPGEPIDVQVRWYRELPDGRREPAEWPRWAPGWEAWRDDMLSRGVITPGIAAWQREQEAEETKPKKQTRNPTIPIIE